MNVDNMKTLTVLLLAACVLAAAQAATIACTLEYAPVCAQAPDGSLRSFPNACSMRAAEEETHVDYTLLRSGSCFQDDFPTPEEII
ncbi:hypothetical protein R5R35_009098 [Gryllus longicercus]|uniref:Kazal-like domain-containing protein n=1 Tax=Gryllus longicercus TaxID=2509291 RepID=A0AAN9W9R3_9ORTH